MGNISLKGHKPAYIPDVNSEPTFPAEFGFPEPRKLRVAKITDEELDALQIPAESRNYCAHILKDIYSCRKKYAPIYVLCKPFYEDYHHCLEEDTNLRKKEYEREKRLRIREMKAKGEVIS